MTSRHTTARRFVLALTLLLFALPLAAQAPEKSDEIKSPDPKWIVGDPAGPPRTGVELEEETKHVASLLRCPVCQGLSVNDSPATMAQNMKRQVRDLAAMGYSQEQSLLYFERAYGEFVRLEPPMRGVNWLVWLAPIALLVVGGFFVLFMMKRLQRAPGSVEATTGAPGTPGRDTLPDDEHLAHYVLRTRELAYGWPGGLSPASRGEGGEESR
ncbi:MAG: cytochrome c-type biogenesis protein [Thermoanaerobaculia bacterium]